MRADRFFARWLARSLRASAGTGAVGTLSLAVSAALVFTVAAVSSGIEGQLGRELRAYGANVVLVPRVAALRYGVGSIDVGQVAEERTLSTAELARLPGALVDPVAPGLAVRATVDGREVAATGYDLAALRRLNPTWRVAPGWPREAREVLVGARLAARLRVAPGARLDLRGGAAAAAATIAGVVETGGPEDEGLVLPLALAQELAGRPGRASLALARVPAGGARGVEEAARRLEAELPGVEARTIQQVARAEAALLGKVRRLLLLVAAAVVAATAFTVSGTLGVLLLARRQELGLCLALGATTGRLRALLLAEAAASGLAGGAAGCLLGGVAAQAIAQGVFGASVPVTAGAPALALGATLAVALGASIWPVARALRVSPCDTLRAP